MTGCDGPHQPRLMHSRLNVSTFGDYYCGDSSNASSDLHHHHHHHQYHHQYHHSGRRRTTSALLAPPPLSSSSSCAASPQHLHGVHGMHAPCCVYEDDVSSGAHRPRQNSVVVYATSHFMTASRRVKSAMDLQTLVLREETEENLVHSQLGPPPPDAAHLHNSDSRHSSSSVGQITSV